jgi:hypothetical protein
MNAEAEDDRAWPSLARLVAAYKLFDVYCAEQGISIRDSDDDPLLAHDILDTLPTDSPHEPFIRAFINYIEGILE